LISTAVGCTTGHFMGVKHFLRGTGFVTGMDLHRRYLAHNCCEVRSGYLWARVRLVLRGCGRRWCHEVRCTPKDRRDIRYQPSHTAQVDPQN